MDKYERLLTLDEATAEARRQARFWCEAFVVIRVGEDKHKVMKREMAEAGQHGTNLFSVRSDGVIELYDYRGKAVSPDGAKVREESRARQGL